jgi:hypothetical protein
MSFSKIVQSALDVADELAPFIEGTPVAAAVNTAKAVVNLIENVRETATTDEAGALNARIKRLDEVLAHLDRTIASLG